MAQRKKTPRAKPNEASASTTQATPGAWERKGVAINLSQARRAALQAFATSDEETASPAQALYALIDTLPTAEPSLATPARPLVDPASAAPPSLVAGLEAKLAAVERLALDNGEALAQCADSLEQIAAAMEPMRELISALLADRRPSEPTALDPAEWMRRAVSALGCSPRSALVFRLALQARSADGERAIALTFEAKPAAIDKAPIKPPVVSLPSVCVRGVPSSGRMAIDLDGDQSGALALFCAPTDRGRWSGQIRRQKSDGSFGPALHEMVF